jgi:predicted alpha/beta-fold hydrolase
VAISAPFDLAASARAFERGGFNRMYLSGLVRSLKRKTFLKLREYLDVVDRARLAAVRTLAEFDDLVTGPVHGFANAEEYWKASSCTPFLASIRIPTLLINALDDPVVPARTLPHQMVPQHPFLTAACTPTGGHVGFLCGPSPFQPVFWAEQTAMAFCERQLERRPDRPPTSPHH